LFHEPLSRAGIRWLLLIVIYFLAASASFSGYFSKWMFRDGSPYFSLPAMLDGTADRPFVYRQLLPAIDNGIERALPERVRNHIQELLTDDHPNRHPISISYPNASDARNTHYVVRYYLMYGLSFAALFLAMFALRAVCLDMQPNRIAATLAPLAFAAIFPLILTEGGYFYDLAELLFMALAVWLALRARVLWLLVVTALATLNKESFLFFVLTLFPFLQSRLSIKKTLVVEFLLLAVAGAVNVAVKFKYAHNPGGVVQFHLLDNLRYLASPSSYLALEYNYGMLTTKGFNLLHIFLVTVLVCTAWSKISPAMRRHLQIAAVINVPLFLAFCYNAELRNLSMLNVGFVTILCVAIATYLERGHREHTLPQAG
jgi:hypothetical protein